MRCLLCGYAEDKVNLVGNLPACSHCEREANSLCTEEAKSGMHGLLLGCFIGYGFDRMPERALHVSLLLLLI